MFSNFQKTIRSEITFKGIGLHTGKNVNLKLIPSNQDTGIVLKEQILIILKTLYLLITLMLFQQSFAQNSKMNLEYLFRQLSTYWVLYMEKVLIIY